MARQLEEINSSGELQSIKKGGAGAEKEVTTKEYVDAADALKQDIANLNDAIKTYLQSGNLDFMRLSAGAENAPDNDYVPNVQDFVRVQMMKWQGAWDINNTPYKWLDVVRDGDWTMIVSNPAGTSDRAAPQPSGDPETEYPVAPTWAEQSFLGVVHSGQKYTFTKGGWVQKLEVFVPELTTDTSYQFVLLDITDPANPVSQILNEPVLLENQWTTISLGNSIVTSGSVLVFYIDALNSGGSSQVTGGWTFQGAAGVPAVPVTANWTRDNANSILRIDKTDADATDRGTELLGMIAGTEIQLAVTAAPDNSLTYKVQAAPVDGGTYVEYSVLLVNQVGTVGVGAITTMTADIPVAQATKYVEDVEFWGTDGNVGNFANMEGYLTLNGVEQTVPGNAYGVRMTFQEAIVSSDWELVAFSGGSSGGGGGGGSALAYRYAKTTDVPVNAVSTDPDWTDVGEVTFDTAQAGIYEYKISLSFNLNSTTTSAYVRFSIDGGVNWSTFQGEPKDITDSRPAFYAFPKEYAVDTPLQLKLQAAKEVAGDVMTVTFADVIIDQKA